MSENEYNTAVTLWKYASRVKSQVEESRRGAAGVLEFDKIVVPQGSGYKLFLELSGFSFRVYAVPFRHNKTGRLSFYVDSALTVRAADRNGDRSTDQDPEYCGIIEQ